jgi:peptidoglycan/xylan/chitin deacetylase (PgdA/CDA1 family)
MGTRQLAVTPNSQRWFSLPGTPVLNYHGLTAGGSSFNGHQGRFEVSRNSFAEHLRHIGASGCRVLLAEELPHSSLSRATKTFSVGLTFDDGRASDYEVAYPMLRNATLGATFFINSATVDTPGHLTWSQLKEMSRGGMSIQSHSHDHVDLSRLSSDQLHYQLRRSKAEIEDRLGREVSLLALPYGSMPQHMIGTAMRLGYKAICSSGGRLARSSSVIIDRVCIYSDTSLQQFAAVLRGSPVFFSKRACRAALLSIPKQIAFGLFPSAVDRWRSRYE